MIFDLDGTLVDTNHQHVEAWRRAFAKHGYTVSPDRIFIEIGKGGDQVIPHLLGREADEKDGDALRKAHPEEFSKIAESQGVRVFPGAVELVHETFWRGLKTALVTSSAEGHIKQIEKSSGVKWRELFDEVVLSDDIEHSKPAPDPVLAAAKKLKLSPAQCAMVGDTPYDAESSKQAGVVCLGLTGGGHNEGTLRRAGCRAVWRDAADLLAHVDEALRVASPGEVRLTQNVMEGLMREALSAAKEGMGNGEVPIGCVLARGSGIVLIHAYNELNRTRNKTAHAEMVAFAKAAGQAPPDARDLILVSTLEPCVMCLGAAMEAAVDTVVYGMKAPADSGTGRVLPPESPESQMPRVVGDILADESRDLFKQWLKKPGNNPQQVAFVRQLLRLESGGPA
jgi:HAD superfamily hydrolase (TIGR01549 family)